MYLETGDMVQPIITEEKVVFKSLIKTLPTTTVRNNYGIVQGEFGCISGCESTYLITGIVAASAITSRSSCLLTRATIKSQNPERTLNIIDNN